MAAPKPGRDLTQPTPPRVWTVGEANVRLEGLREELPRLRALALRLQKVHAELERLAEFWGKELDAPDHADRALHERLRGERQALGERLRAEIERLHAEGIEVKDLEAGLVDFFSTEAGEVVFLCWQMGEEKVAYFHTLEGGYRNRRPIGSFPRHSATSARGPPN